MGQEEARVLDRGSNVRSLEQEAKDRGPLGSGEDGEPSATAPHVSAGGPPASERAQHELAQFYTLLMGTMPSALG